MFGTLGRRRKKKGGGGEVETSSSMFSSTPANLHKIGNIEQAPPPTPPPLPVAPPPLTLSSFGKTREAHSPTPPPLFGKKPSTSSSSSLRSFLSMMNVVGTLKRSKSIRKLGWASTMNLPSPSSASASPTSVEHRDHQWSMASTLPRKGHRQPHSPTNNEPGVASSESSSESSSIRESSDGRSFAGEFMDGDDGGMGGSRDPALVERNKSILQATKRFNLEPKKGIQLLVDKGIIEYSPESVARFLKEGYGLSKAGIGTYLGERGEFNESVLKCFVALFCFKDLILVPALRQFLWAFRLPGESQKISRMLDAFADKYVQDNPELGVGAETASILCYSVIMLNTELHNPAVKDKVTLEQFVKRNKGIEGGERFSDQFYTSLYNSILQEPFQFPEEDGNDLMLTFFNPDYEGWLYKYGGRPKSWKRLWFILSNNCLYFFKFTTDKTPRGIIPLENILVRTPTIHGHNHSKLYTFVLYKKSPDPKIVDFIKTCKTLRNGSTVPKLFETIQLGVGEEWERDRWIRSINANHSMSQFYSDLTLRKMRKEKGGVPGVRKSQIGLPSTTLLGAELDPSKDPNNFFSMKNLSSISLMEGEAAAAALVHPPPLPTSHSASLLQDVIRVRSQSESRIYKRGGGGRKSPSPSCSPVVQLRAKKIHNGGTGALATTPPESPSHNANATIYDKYKKLSMIRELTNKCVSVEELQVLPIRGSSEDEETPHLQIIDCSDANIRTRVVPLEDHNFPYPPPPPSEDEPNITTPTSQPYISIYESNV